MEGTIFNIQKFSIHDGPGIRTTVFFKGCSLRCKWCANPESQLDSQQLITNIQKCTRCGRCMEVCPKGARVVTADFLYPTTDFDRCNQCLNCSLSCPSGAIKLEGTKSTIEEIVTEVLKDKPFYDTSGGGVTLSGGEVLLQHEFASELCRSLHKEGVSVAIETAGHVPADVFSEFIREVDLVFIDLKHYNSEKHKEGTEVGNEQIIENIKTLGKSQTAFIVRIPVIPGFNDSLEDAAGFGELLQNLGISQVQLLPFHQMGEAKYTNLGKSYSFKGQSALHPKDLENFKAVMEKYIKNIQIGGYA